MGGDIGIGIANGGGTISDMFHPSERAYVRISFPQSLILTWAFSV